MFPSCAVHHRLFHSRVLRNSWHHQPQSIVECLSNVRCLPSDTVTSSDTVASSAQPLDSLTLWHIYRPLEDPALECWRLNTVISGISDSLETNLMTVAVGNVKREQINVNEECCSGFSEQGMNEIELPFRNIHCRCIQNIYLAARIHENSLCCIEILNTEHLIGAVHQPFASSCRYQGILLTLWTAL